MKLLGTYGGRDKALKLIHYICRTTSGGLVDVINGMPKSDPKRIALQTKQKLIHSVFVQIMESRRTFRWLASLPVLLGLYRGKSAWKNKNMFIIAQLGLVWWHVIDHVRWLQRLGLVTSGTVQRSKQISFAGFAVSNLVSTIYFGQQVWAAQGKRKSVGSNGSIPDVTSSSTAISTRVKDQLQLAKSAMTFVMCLHISELWMSHEVVCGLCGAASSAIDLFLLFPRKPTSPIADAKKKE